MADSQKLTPKQQAIADEVIERVTNGESLRAICKDMRISHNTFKKFRDIDPDIQTRYARAQEDRATLLFEEILTIADAADENVQASKLQVDARKWVLSKMMPKKYGDKVDLNVNDGAEPIPLEFVVEKAKGKVNVTKG